VFKNKFAGGRGRGVTVLYIRFKTGLKYILNRITKCSTFTFLGHVFLHEVYESATCENSPPRRLIFKH